MSVSQGVKKYKFGDQREKSQDFLKCTYFFSNCPLQQCHSFKNVKTSQILDYFYLH